MTRANRHYTAGNIWQALPVGPRQLIDKDNQSVSIMDK